MAFWVIIALEVLILRNYRLLGAAGLLLLALVSCFGVVVAVLRGRAQILLLGWILIFPLGYYFLAFPKDHQIITLDRTLIVLLLVSACFSDSCANHTISRALGKSAAYWLVFLLFAALTIPIGKTSLTSLRLLLEAFLFPALLAWYVLRYFEPRRYLSALHAITCVMAMYVAAIGIGEVILQRDLLPIADSSLLMAGDTGEATKQLLVRPNGPFASTNSFAMVGLVSFFFLVFLKKALAGDMPVWQRLLHRLGTAAALAEALMPLFKSVLVSLVLVLIVGSFYRQGGRRFVQLGAILSLGCALLFLQMALPSVFEERADSETFNERVAQEKQTLAVVIDHPLVGVGFANFSRAVGSGRYAASFKGAEALDSPHNILGAIFAETGVIGFLPFGASQALFVIAFWRLRRAKTKDSKLAWEVFLFIFLCYWINGLALALIYSEDLNLWYMLVLAVLYKFAITSPDVLSSPRSSGTFGSDRNG
ncbi:MAG: O-antigen ligase family protein [Candidatus Sulfotelmatobacter sp.]